MPELTIHGTRGQRPASGPAYDRYGGHTTCFSILAPDRLIVIDAGTGLTAIPGLRNQPAVTLLFTHFHLDHLLGLPSLPGLVAPDADIVLMGDPRRAHGWRQAVQTFVGQPFWPVSLAESHTRIRFEDLPVASGVLELPGVALHWMSVPHPQECLAFRVATAGGTAVIATDVEYAPGAVDEAFVEFCRGTDILIMDAQFTPEEYPRFRGWGHSSWGAATEAARRAGVGRLILTHHAPDRTDSALDGVLAAARREFAATAAAHDGMRFSLR